MSRPARVLLVDDNAEFARMVMEMLRLVGGYALERAESLTEMRQKLQAGDYAVILLDHHLPDGTGLEALPELTERPDSPPVVMVTGAGDERVASEAIKGGAYDYLMKSGDMAKLPLVVERAIRMHAVRLAQRRAEAQLRYQAWLLDNVSDAIVVVDSAGVVTFWNRGAEAMFGVAQNAALGKRVLEAFGLQPDDPWAHTMQQLFRTAGAIEEVQLHLPSGESLWVDARASVLHHDGGRPAGHMVVFRDVTERKALTEKVQAAQSRLFEAARMAAIGELASSVAHQINNPLTTVLGEAQMLARELQAESPTQKAAQAIQEAGWRAARVVQHLMDLSEPPQATASEVDVNATILTATELVGKRLEERGAVLRLLLAPRLSTVRARERDLLDLWVNLLLAAKEAVAGLEGAEIRLETAAEGEEVRVQMEFPGELTFDRLSAGEERGLYGLCALGLAEELVRQVGGRSDIWVPKDGRRGVRVSLPAVSTEEPRVRSVET